ncbi:MFS transporter [Lentilactobacillus hilgardii]|uniref:MFS transporter n=1 Tax=Lentilactobacillus hilgardii TaxID=1588 RepID=UPI0021A51B8F|nr:MFS transporter [Lentilactobacillus hilgardii]
MNKLKYVLPILLLGNLLCMMDVSIMTIVLPEIQTAFKVSLSDLSWALNVYTIVFATFIIPFGRFAEKIGRNKFVFIGLIVFGIGSLLTGLSTNLSLMLIARIIQSIGAASIIPTSMVIGLELSNRQNRHKIVAALAGVQGLAVALGPSIGGAVSQYWGWRWVFFINIPLVILDLLIYPFILSMKNEPKSNLQIDWIGALLSIIMLFSLSLGLIKGNTWRWQSSSIVGLFIAASVSFSAFVLIEQKLKSPMINMSLFKSRNFVGSGMALVLCNFFLGGMAILIPTFLTRIYGESELHAALLITPYSVAVMFSVIGTSLFVKRVNNKLLISGGFILIGISYYLLSEMKLDQNYTEMIIAAVTLGIGYGLVAATANILAVADFHGSLLTDSQSVANVLRQVGMVLAIAIFMTVLSNNIVNAKQETLTYSKQQIARMTLSNQKRTLLMNRLQHKLNPENTAVTNSQHELKFQHVSVSNKKNKNNVSKGISTSATADGKNGQFIRTSNSGFASATP